MTAGGPIRGVAEWYCDPSITAHSLATPMHNYARDFCNEVMNIHAGPKVGYGHFF